MEVKDKAGLTSLLCFSLRHFFEQQGFQCLLSKPCFTLNSFYISEGQKALFNTPRPCFKFRKKFQSPEKKRRALKNTSNENKYFRRWPWNTETHSPLFFLALFQIVHVALEKSFTVMAQVIKISSAFKNTGRRDRANRSVLVSLHIAVTNIPSTSRVREELSCCLGGFILSW